MKRFMIYDLRFMIFFILFFLIINHISLFINPTLATTSTPSADPLRQSDSEASIKSQLEELKKQIASKAAKLKQEVNRKLKDRAYVGVIQSKSDNSFTIATPSGPKTFNISVDTIFASKVKGKQKFSQKTIALKDFVAALGDVDETEVLTAKKIILLPPADLQPKTFLWGQVISVSDDLVTIRDKERKNVAVARPKSSKVSVGETLIFTGVWDKNDIFDAGFVYVVPGIKAKMKRMVYPTNSGATPSASLKATPKATSSAKPAVKKTS